MTVLIIGNIEFLGKFLASKLLQHGVKIIFLSLVDIKIDNHDELSIFNIKNINKFYDFFQTHNIKLVVNIHYLDSYLKRSIAKLDWQLTHQNIQYTYDILNSIHWYNKNNSYKKRISYIACFQNSIFGNQEDEMGSVFNINPKSFYATFLASCFHIHNFYQNQFNSPITQIIVGNLYGINQNSTYDYLPMIINNYINNKNIIIHGNGEVIRNWLNIEDLCAIMTIMITNNIAQKIFHINGNNLKIIDFIRLVGQKCEDYAIKNNLDFINFNNLIKFEPSRENKYYSYAMQNNQYIDFLKYNLRYNLENSLDYLIDYYYKKLIK